MEEMDEVLHNFDSVRNRAIDFEDENERLQKEIS
jgi:hypothetical protein